MAVDTIIKDGLIVDGDGAAPYHGDVAIQDGKIVGLGSVNDTAARVIDAGGLAVAPGFWDVHTHYDAQLLWDPLATSSSWHGVTTVVMGNCGFTLAPCRPDDQDWLVQTLARVEGMNADVLRRTLPWGWEDFRGYLDTLDQALGVNTLPQVGHTAVRRYVMGAEASERESTPDEVRRMRQVIAESLKAGANGFTSSRSRNHWDGDGRPIPSRVSSLDEYFSLVEELAAINVGWVQAAMPDFKRHDFAEVARRSQRPVCWNDVVQRPDRPDAWKGQLQRMLAMRDEGHRFIALGHCQPHDLEFTFGFTDVFDRWPTWQKVMFAPFERKVSLMRDQAVRRTLRDEMAGDPAPTRPRSWERVMLVRSATGKYREYERQMLVEIAANMGREPMDAAFDIALDEDLRTHFRMLDSLVQDPAATIAILKTPHVVPGLSDGGAHVVTELNTGFPTHLLGHWVREAQALKLEEAVHLLSGKAAAELSVTGRGLLREGYAADVTLFDPATVASGERRFVDDLPGGGRRLVQDAIGIEYTIVNGVVTQERGKPTGDLGGRTLRSYAYAKAA